MAEAEGDRLEQRSNLNGYREGFRGVLFPFFVLLCLRFVEPSGAG
jgi:hypothetical protein